MKNNFLFLCLFLYGINSNAQNINFTDSNFKNALLNHTPIIDTNTDGEIQETEASAFTDSLDISNQNITNIDGIEFFTNLTVLNCESNVITNIDMASNTLLTEIYADDNMLTSFSVIENTNLEKLYCSYNSNLTTIDVTNNPVLSELWCRFNQLTGTLNCSNNTQLSAIICNDNNLTIINLANGNNQNISQFNLDNNPNLEYVYVDDPGSFFASFLNNILPASVQVVVDPNTATNTNTLNKFITIYPNPASDFIQVKTDKNIISFVVFDLNGRVIMTKQANDIKQINIINLNSGTYFCKIKDDANLQGFIKIIKK